MSKHTPEPWRVEGDLGFTVIDNSGTIICQMPYTMTAMQHYANARLLVAAPEMLELLRDVRQYVADANLRSDCYAEIHLKAIDALLAKIKGGGDGA